MNSSVLSFRHGAIAMLLGALCGTPAALQAGPEQERTISFYHIHTKETLTVTYKKDGTYVSSALKSINWFMRDWRQDTEIDIDPRAIDILWEMHTELGSKEPIHIICGYRSRKTNNMLRRTRGGQASNSLHITGKAIDAAFPDVPVRHVRYAALIRERGGVGYYPTSAIPFVHVDTGRVRHWPRMKRDELALLFADRGHSKHVPSGGRRLRPSDVKSAKARQRTLATQVAAYHDIRRSPSSPLALADSGLIKPPKPVRAERPPQPVAKADPQPPAKVAGLAPKPETEAQPWQVEVAPNMQLALATPGETQNPEPAIMFSPRPSETDQARLDRLIAEATFVPLVEPPRLLRAKSTPEEDEDRESPDSSPAALSSRSDQTRRRTGKAGADRFAWTAGLVAVVDDDAWARAPDYDDDHPDELAYRPFPLEPIMTAQIDDPSLSKLTKPDNVRTLDLLDQNGIIQPMRLRPPQQVAQLMWRQEFSGAAVELYSGDGEASAGNTAAAPALGARRVSTSRE